MNSSHENKADSEQDRKQKVIERDSNNRIIKTFDGFVYRIFDDQGRLIELYGNWKKTDNNKNFRTKIELNDSLVIGKEYFFDDKNINCEIIDTLDCYITKFYYKNNKLIKAED